MYSYFAWALLQTHTPCQTTKQLILHNILVTYAVFRLLCTKHQELYYITKSFRRLRIENTSGTGCNGETCSRLDKPQVVKHVSVHLSSYNCWVNIMRSKWDKCRQHAEVRVYLSKPPWLDTACTGTLPPKHRINLSGYAHNNPVCSTPTNTAAVGGVGVNKRAVHPATTSTASTNPGSD